MDYETYIEYHSQCMYTAPQVKNKNKIRVGYCTGYRNRNSLDLFNKGLTKIKNHLYLNYRFIPNWEHNELITTRNRSEVLNSFSRFVFYTKRGKVTVHDNKGKLFKKFRTRLVLLTLTYIYIYIYILIIYVLLKNIKQWFSVDR